ncbi:hypothetical protein RhiirA5_493957 [Rhizophagus irregularis]|uniref:Uncharacterized protein n=3 Tax=Rhizophagus irregularis TaxID=588596 RepID=A0A2N0QAV9_9GLOM|nr:hypothetical protein RhiirA5_493957 [Rhizophagus irregularis]
MATFLLSECLEIIFSKLTEYPSNDIKKNVPTKDLYSCTLVSRHWCRVSTPLLYAYPFHHFRFNYSQINYYKLIRTLLSCIPKIEIKQIYKQTLQIPFLKIKNSKTNNNLSTFNYISFINGFIFSEMILETQMICNHYNKEIWLIEYKPKRITNESTITIMNYLIEFMCKHCNNNLIIFEFSSDIKYNINDDIIKLLNFNDYVGKSKLSNLKELYYHSSSLNRYGNNFDLYLSNNICNLNLLFICYNGIKSIKIANILSQFISSQKMLKHFILSGFESKNKSNFNLIHLFFHDYYNLVINSLSTQNQSLQILEFRHFIFEYLDENVINSLQSLKNIRILKLFKCENLDFLHSWIKYLENFEVFEITMINNLIILNSTILIQLIKSFQSIQSNIFTKLIINDDNEENDYTQLFQQIPLYLYSLTHLELPKICPPELISIFISCTKLVYISVLLLLNNELLMEILENLGESVPKTLKRIQFKRLSGNIHLTISLELLTFFLKGYANNVGILEYLELGNKGNPINIITKQFGVQIIEYSHHI